MSFENYADLKAEIKSFLWDRPDVEARIPSFVKLAETEARRLLKTREANATQKFAYSAGMTSIPCGAGNILAVRLGGDDVTPWRDLNYVSPEMFSTIPERDLRGYPRFYTVQNERIMFAPRGDAASQGEIVYIDSFCPLKNDDDCNWLLRDHPDIYLCGALKWGKAWLIDGDWDWATPFYSAIKAANAEVPRVQMNTTLRADEATFMGSRRRSFNIYTGGY